MGDTFRLRQPGLRKLLGDLEASVMEVVWSQPDGATITVREVYEALLAKRKIAYTSVMTVMSNLTKKGVLAVEKSGTAYLYRAPLSQKAFTDRAIGAIVSELVADFSDPAFAHFTKALEGAGVEDKTMKRLRKRIEALGDD